MKLDTILIFAFSSLIVIASVLAYYHAFADTIDFSKCGYGKCFQYAPQNNITPLEQVNPNWSFSIFMPDRTCNITGLMDNLGNCNVDPVIVSDDNMTHMKENVGIESVKNIHTVSSNPNTGYCRLGLFTMNHQDGYLSRVYNPPTNLDLLGFMYPSFCYAETGPNPIDGNHTIPSIPEFPFVIIELILSMSLLVVLTRKN